MKIKVARKKVVRAIQTQRTGSTSSSSTKKIAATCAKVLALPKMLGRKSRRPAIMKSTPLISRMEMSRLNTTTVYFQGITLFDGEHEKHGAHQQFVGDGVEILAEQGLLMQGAGEQAVEAVAQSGENEQRQRPFEIVLDQIDDDEGQENHAQQRELIGRGQDLPVVHRYFSPPACLRLSQKSRELAHQKRGGILSGLLGEALGEREDVALGKIEFHSFQAVHGKEDDAGGEGLAALDLRGEIVERRDIDAAQAEAFGRKMENRAPEFFARVGQRRDHERARTKGADGLRFLIKACTGHDAIVVCGGGKLQTEFWRLHANGCVVVIRAKRRSASACQQ